MDAYSEWLDVYATTSSKIIIKLLQKLFDSLGLQEVVLSDQQFADFMKNNGIRQVRSPRYHLSSNGLAERAVQTLKEGLKKVRSGSLETRLSKFLLNYRITPHSSIGSSPAELMWGRTLTSKLDLLRPDVDQKAQQATDCQKSSHDGHSSQRQFAVNETVYARNYSSGPQWLPGKIVSLQGNVMYCVRL